MKNRLTQTIVMTAGLCFAASSPAELLVDLNAAKSGPASLWVSSAGSFPGWYEDDDQQGAPVNLTDTNGVTFFSTASANTSGGFFGGDDSGGSQQHPSGSEPQFVLNGTNPGDFTFEIWMRKRGNRIGPTHDILGMKSANINERFFINLWDSDGNEGSMDIGMRSEAGASQVFHVDQFPLLNRAGDAPFDYFVFTWDNSASSMDLFHNATNGFSNLTFTGVQFSSSTIFNGTTLFESFANDAAGNHRFNGDIARVMIHDEIIDQATIDLHFSQGPNGLPEPIITGFDVVDETGLTFTSAVSQTYVFEKSDDALTGIWERASMTIEGNGGVITVFDPDGYSSNKVYRLIELP